MNRAGGRLPLGLNANPRATRDVLDELMRRVVEAKVAGKLVKFYVEIEKLSACVPQRVFVFEVSKAVRGSGLTIKFPAATNGDASSSESDSL
eukprot:tig00000492_g1435.t1